MENLESAEYYLRAFEAEQVIRRKLEIECDDLKNALKNMVEKFDFNKKIYESLLTGKNLNLELLDTSRPLTQEQKEIVAPAQPGMVPEPAPATSALAPKTEEGF